MAPEEPAPLPPALAATAAWAALWLLVHHLCRRGGPSGGRRAARAAALRRGPLFGAAASLAGLRLLLRGAAGGAEPRLLLAMAAGHWLVAAWEDRAGGGWRGAPAPGAGGPLGPLLLRARGLHAGLAAGGYACLAALPRCEALGVLGLLSELPPLLLDVRELALSRGGPPPPWLRTRAAVERFWGCAYGLAALLRGGPLVLYVCSLVSWRGLLDALEPLEELVYHFSALAFAALSFALVGSMEAWHLGDLEAARKFGESGAGRMEDAEAGLGGDERQSSSAPFDPTTVPPKPILPEVLASKAGADPDDSIWVAVDGAAYDVTAFLHEHPGGAEVLRRWAGKDASDAFHKAGHSEAARAAMAQYLVGPVSAAPTTYRIFEHLEAESAAAAVLSALVLSFVAKAVALHCLAPGGQGGATAPDLLELLLLALLLAVAMGLLALGLARCSAAAAPPRPRHALALGLLAYHGGLLAACRTQASSGPRAAELAAGAVLLLQEWLAGSAGRGWDQLFRRAAALALVLWSWKLRGEAFELTDLAGLGLLALTLGFSVHFICHHSVGCSKNCGRTEEIVALVANMLQLSGMYGLLGIVALCVGSPSAWQRLTLLWAAPSSLVAGLLVAAAASMAALGGLVNAASRCSPAFAARAAGFALAAIGAGSSCSWLSALGFLGYLAELAACNRLRLRAAGDAGLFAELPPHVVGAQALWDRARFWLASALWRSTVILLQPVINRFMPPQTRVYACEIPVPNLGPRASYGFAAHLASRTTQCQPQPMPQHFVYNIGQVAQSCIIDIQKSMNNVLDIWHEFEEPTMKGLVANVIAVVPTVASEQRCKEINLTAWESGRDAYEWYVKSKGHRTALFMHHSGILRSLGASLATLEAGKRVHQDRCRMCARPVDATELGSRAASHCRVCGGPTFQYPAF